MGSEPHILLFVTYSLVLLLVQFVVQLLLLSYSKPPLAHLGLGTKNYSYSYQLYLKLEVQLYHLRLKI